MSANWEMSAFMLEMTLQSWPQREYSKCKWHIPMFLTHHIQYSWHIVWPHSSGFSFSSDSGQRGLEEAIEDVKKNEDQCARRPRSVQWLDLGQSMLFDDLFGQYRALLWARCSKALWLQMHVPHGARSTGSINLHDNHRIFQVLQQMSHASNTGEKTTSVQHIASSTARIIRKCHLMWLLTDQVHTDALLCVIFSFYCASVHQT